MLPSFCSPYMLRAFLVSSIVITGLYLLSTSFASPTLSFPFQMSRPLDSWIDSTRPHPNPHSFTPTLSALALATLRNAPAEHKGFTLALFHPHQSETEPVAITSSGRVLIVPQATFNSILNLVDQTRALPSTESFRNTWVIKQDRTSQPIDRLITFPSSSVSTSDDDREGEMKQVSVQGFDHQARELKAPTAGYNTLPDPLFELTAAVLEARDHETGRDKDEIVLARVRELVSSWF